MIATLLARLTGADRLLPWAIGGVTVAALVGAAFLAGQNSIERAHERGRQAGRAEVAAELRAATGATRERIGNADLTTGDPDRDADVLRDFVGGL